MYYILHRVPLRIVLLKETLYHCLQIQVLYNYKNDKTILSKFGVEYCFAIY